MCYNNLQRGDDMSNFIMKYEVQTELEKFVSENGANVDNVIFTIVYDFAKNLPYSMDPKDKDFVPGDFLNFKPVESNHYIFKWWDSMYAKMIDWGDSLKSGVLLEACFIFQKMLMGEIPNDYQLSEEDYYNMGINSMTGNDGYSRKLFEVLKKMPDYYKKVNSISNFEERRKALDDVYSVMKNEIGNKVGGMSRAYIEDGKEVSVVHGATISWSPYRDVEMVYAFSGVHNFGGINCKPLIDGIKSKVDLPVTVDKEVAKKLSR